MKLRHSIVGLVLFVAFLCTPALKAQDGLRGAMFGGRKTAHVSPVFSTQIAVADFDNDQKPDGAVLVETGLLDGKRAFRIELHVTAGDSHAITFSSAESDLAISALDVNRDGMPDIVIEKSLTHERLQVFLNDGHGTFHKARTEDYPSLNPLAPGWHARLTEEPPAFCLAGCRGLENGSLQRISMLSRGSPAQLNFSPETFLAHSGARAPTATRAPPFVLL